MFIPPSGYQQPQTPYPEKKGPIRLESSHLYIDKETAEKTFGQAGNVLLAFYPEKGSLLLASIDNEEFKSIHKTTQHILKARNANGDRSVALHELLIDHQLDETDRELDYELIPGLGILNVGFK